MKIIRFHHDYAKIIIFITHYFCFQKDPYEYLTICTCCLMAHLNKMIKKRTEKRNIITSYINMKIMLQPVEQLLIQRKPKKCDIDRLITLTEFTAERRNKLRLINAVKSLK